MSANPEAPSGADDVNEPDLQVLEGGDQEGGSERPDPMEVGRQRAEAAAKLIGSLFHRGRSLRDRIGRALGTGAAYILGRPEAAANAAHAGGVAAIQEGRKLGAGLRSEYTTAKVACESRWGKITDVGRRVSQWGAEQYRSFQEKSWDGRLERYSRLETARAQRAAEAAKSRIGKFELREADLDAQIAALQERKAGVRTEKEASERELRDLESLLENPDNLSGRSQAEIDGRLQQLSSEK